MEKNLKKNMCVCMCVCVCVYIYISESLCCIVEMSTTLYINYSSIKEKKKLNTHTCVCGLCKL